MKGAVEIDLAVNQGRERTRDAHSAVRFPSVSRVPRKANC